MLECLGQIANRLTPASIRRGLSFVIGELNDWRLGGLETAGGQPVTQAGLRQCPDAVRYVPTGYPTLAGLLRYVGADDVFVDVGCGKGRVICFVASKRALKQVVGVELMADLAEAARQNVARANLLTPVAVLEGDASQVDLSEGTVYYLFNPFGEDTMRRFLGAVRESLRVNPRLIRIIYHRPVHARALEATDWLVEEEVPTHLEDRIRMWRSGDPGGTGRDRPQTAGAP